MAASDAKTPMNAPIALDDEALAAVAGKLQRDIEVVHQAMTTPEKDRLLKGLKANPPADPESIRRFEAESHFRLPDSYAEFLRRANGGEGFIVSVPFVGMGVSLARPLASDFGGFLEALFNS